MMHGAYSVKLYSWFRTFLLHVHTQIFSILNSSSQLLLKCSGIFYVYRISPFLLVHYSDVWSMFISVELQPNSGLDRLIVEDHTQLDTCTHTHTHTPCRSPLNEWSARRRGRYLHNTKQIQDRNIHAVSGIRTRQPQQSSGHRHRHGTAYIACKQLVCAYPGFKQFDLHSVIQAEYSQNPAVLSTTFRKPASTLRL